MESFAPTIYLALAYFEKQNTIISSKNANDKILEGIFLQFPRNIPQYKEMIKNLYLLSESNSESILHYLSKITKKILNDARDTPFGILQGISSSFDPNNRQHFLLFYFFSLFFLSDLICGICANYPIKNQKICFSIARTGFKVITSKHLLENTFDKIIEQWTVIYSFLSQYSFSSVSAIYSQFVKNDFFELSLKVLRFIRFDSDDSIGQYFLTEVLSTLQKYVKKKAITKDILESLSMLIVSLPYNETIFQKLILFLKALRFEKSLVYDSFLLYVSVSLRYSKSFHDCIKTFKKKIIPNAYDKEKLPLILQCFKLLMYGRNVDPNWLFWIWGENPRTSNLSYVKYNGAIRLMQEFNFFDAFMEYFFEKADFSICLEKFRDIFIHFASLDFEQFMKKIVPKFLELSDDDPRYLSFIMSVPFINSDDFKSNAFKLYTDEQILQFNKLIKQKVLSTLIMFDGKNEKHRVCFIENDEFLKSYTDEADQNLIHLLHEWEITEFGMLIVKHKHSKYFGNQFSKMEILLPSIPYVLSEEDLRNQHLIYLLVALSYHQNNKISSTAYKISCNILSKSEFKSQYLSILISMIKTDLDPEATFIVLSLLNDIFSSTKSEIEKVLLNDIEYIVFLSLSSIYPNTRHLAFLILQKLNLILNGDSIAHIIENKSDIIEKNVKKKILLFCISNNMEIKALSTDIISFETSMFSHYYDIWIFFLSEIMNTLIDSNYLPLFSRIEKNKGNLFDLILNESKNRNPSDIGLLLIILSSQYYISRRHKNSFESLKKYQQVIYERKDSRSFVTNVLFTILQNKNYRISQMGFSVLPHVHPSLFPLLIDMVSKISIDNLYDASKTLTLILHSPDLDKHFFKRTLRKIISFMTLLQYYFIRRKLNSSRNIQWNQESEIKLSRESELIINYCSIVNLSFSNFFEPISDDIWPLSCREMIFRFLLNWSLTTSPTLELLRRSASSALSTIIRLGTFFNDSHLFDDRTLNLFGKLEADGMNILTNLLGFNLDLLLDIYINSCYTKPRAVADLFFEALTNCMKPKNSKLIYPYSGSLLLLILIYNIRENPYSIVLLNNFLDIVHENNHEFDLSVANNLIQQSQLKNVLPKLFSFATEAVFASVFSVLKMSNLHIPIKDIIESIRPWISVIRLLPKQSICAQDVSPLFNYFTPYQFLENLIQTTEAVDDDQFRSIASIWVELFKSPDHTEIIPIFISNWENIETKQKLCGVLFDAYPEIITGKLSNRFSFAYFFHVTRCLKRSFTPELWIAPLLSQVSTKSWNALLKIIPSFIHFIIIFRDNQLFTPIFNSFCKKLKVSCPEVEMTSETLRDVVDQIIEKLQDISSSYIESWGNESLKWIIGSSDLKLTVRSFTIYNRIHKDVDTFIINSIIRTLYYYLSLNNNEPKLLTDLVTESFIFFNEAYEGNELLAFNFVASFLDCRLFVETSLINARKLFKKFLSFPEIHTSTYTNAISIIRPLIPQLETDTEVQGIIDEIIKGTKSDEIMMLIAPIKLNNPQLFPSCSDVNILLSHSTDSILCNTLANYSMLLKHCSLRVMNNIFDISSLIVSKIVNENNRISLAKIYQIALHSISRCSSAFKFICVLLKQEPNVAKLSVIDVYEWDRTIEDVTRSIKLLVVPDESPIVTITDCLSYKSVTRFLNADVLPKILPYVSENELLIGMKRVSKEHKARTEHMFKRSYQNYRSILKADSFDEISTKIDYKLSPLIHPQTLIFEPLQDNLHNESQTIIYSMDSLNKCHSNKRSSVQL